jgi:hypothetical protein
MEYTREQIEAAKAAIKRGVMVKFGDLPITGITVTDEDATRYLGGATVEELLGAS